MASQKDPLLLFLPPSSCRRDRIHLQFRHVFLHRRRSALGRLPEQPGASTPIIQRAVWFPTFKCKDAREEMQYISGGERGETRSGYGFGVFFCLQLQTKEKHLNSISGFSFRLGDFQDLIRVKVSVAATLS